MSNAKRPAFPCFVIADREAEIVEIDPIFQQPPDLPLVSVAIPVKDELQDFLAWFTRREFAVDFCEKNGLVGYPLEMNNPKEVVLFLEPRTFFGIAVNPSGPGHLPRTCLYEWFVESFRRMARDDEKREPKNES